MESTADLSSWLSRLATYQYFAEQVAGRDVLEVDCRSGRGAGYLARLGARSVLAVGPDEDRIASARAAHALTNLEFKVGTAIDLPAADRSVDLVLVDGGTRLVRRRAALDEVDRVLRPGGALVLSIRSADRPGARGGSSYYDALDRLAARFSAVRMFALAPFVGASLVAYDESRPAVELDTTLLELAPASRGDDDVTHYVAVCGDADVTRGFSVVQVPAFDGLAAWSRELGAEPGDVADAPDDETGADERRPVADALDRAEAVAVPGPSDDSVVRLDRALAGQRVAERRLAAVEQQLEQAHRELSRMGAQAEARAAQSRDEAGAMSARIAELEAVVSEQERALQVARRDAEERSSRGEAERPVDQSGDRLTAGQLAAAVERLEDLEHTLQAERDVAHELERALRALRDSARPEADDADADARAKVRELLDEVGSKDADIAVLKFGLDALRGKLRELVESVKAAQRDMNGQSASEMVAVMDQLTATLEPFADA